MVSKSRNVKKSNESNKMKEDSKKNTTSTLFIIIKWFVDTLNNIIFGGNINSAFYKDFTNFKNLHDSSYDFNKASLKVVVFISVYLIMLAIILELNKSALLIVNVCKLENRNVLGNVVNLIDFPITKYIFFHIFFPPSVFMGNFLDDRKLFNPSTVFFINLFMSYTDTPTEMKICTKKNEENNQKNNDDENRKNCYDIQRMPKPCSYVNIIATFCFYLLYYFINRYLLEKLLTFVPAYIYDFSLRFLSEKASISLRKIFSNLIKSIILFTDNIAFYYLVFLNYYHMMNILLSASLKNFQDFWLLQYIFPSNKNVVDALIVIMNVIFVILFFGIRYGINYMKNEFRQIFFDVYGQTKKRFSQLETKLENMYNENQNLKKIEQGQKQKTVSKK